MSDVDNLVTLKPVKTMEDLKGMKIRTIAGPSVDMLKALGAVPVVMPMPDVYMALQKGTLDGVMADWEPIQGFRFHEVAKYVTTNTPFSYSLFTLIMNKDKFNSLPRKPGPPLKNTAVWKPARPWPKVSPIPPGKWPNPWPMKARWKFTSCPHPSASAGRKPGERPPGKNG